MLFLLFLACAQEGFPPGGPQDRFPPFVVDIQPPPGSTRVPVNTRPVIRFNERMDLESLEEAVFVAPLTPFRLKANWGGDEITLVFDQPLSPDQTYVMTIGTGARDIRGNRMASSRVTAFSTGPAIDNGEIAGAVVSEARAGIGAFVWAYHLGRNPAPDPEKIPPDYIVQAGQNGGFAFSNLSPGRYRLFAFLDRGRDGRYNPGLDPLGIPSGEVTITAEAARVEHQRLVLALRDTVSLALLSARPRDTTHLLLRFNKPVETATLRDTTRYRITDRSDGTSLGVRSAYRTPADSLSISLITAPQSPRDEYEIMVTGLTDLAGRPLDPSGAVGVFSGSGEPDARPPALLRTAPADSARDVPLEPVLTLVFSEAVRADAGAILLTDGHEPMPVSLQWDTPAVAHLRPDSALAPNTTYRILLLAQRIRDWTGNPLQPREAGQDTVKVHFTSVDPGVYGMVSGMVSDEDTTGTGAIYLRLTHTDDRTSRYQTAIPAPGAYRFDAVLPGRYAVSAYRDADGDGRWSPGAVLPFRPAERTAASPDTVLVRSGWESEQVNLLFHR